MKYVEEYRDAHLVRGVMDEIRRTVTRPWVLMEICGGQTHAIIRHGLDQLLPPEIELVHGPGCPVCVTPLELIDKALAIASQPGVIFASYGDMLRVPGSGRDLFSVRAAGGDVRVVYSPLDALKIAQQNPEKQVVFFAIGFETTAPANVMSVMQARADGAEKLQHPGLACARTPGHARHPVCAAQPRAGLPAGGACLRGDGLLGIPVAGNQYGVPMAVTGFEPLDLTQGILQTVRMLEEGRVEVENAYPRLVTFEGNRPAQQMIGQVFQERDRKWRGIGMIPNSGWGLRAEFDEFNAEKRFDVQQIQPEESPLCIAGLVLQGLKKPHECTAFGVQCTPETPLGATMVSSEGACAAYYRYKRSV